jgi:hypothetical protein
MLVRVFSLAVAMVIITPAFYAYAVETESEHGRQVTATEKKESEEREHAKAPVRDRMKTACVKVRTSISNRTANLQLANERHIGVIDKVYGNLTTFANNQHITVPEANRQAVLLAHDAASNAIQQLANSEDALNCEDVNVGQAAAALELNIQAVNDTMRMYRNAVSDMLAAVKAQALTGGVND